MKRKLIFLWSWLLIGACAEPDVAPTPGDALFTLIIDANINTKASGDWLIIHGADGKLLYSKLYDAGDTVRYESSNHDANDKISVTLFNYTSPRNQEIYYKLNTYLQIPVGEVWTIRKPVENFEPRFRMGTFKVTAKDIQPYTRFSISDKRGDNGLFTYVLDSNHYECATDLVTGASDFLLTLRDPQDEIRYAFFEDVKATHSYTASFPAMSIPETILQVSFPKSDGVFLQVQGFEQDQPKTQEGYWLYQDYEYETARTKMNIGYLDKFQYYRTYFAIENSKGRYEYDKKGEKPKGITLPVDAVYDITNRSVTHFAFTANTNFIRRESVWSNWIYKGDILQTVIEWNVHSPAEGEQHVGEFPPSFKTIYPDFKFDRLPHTSTTFYLSGASSYEDVIENSFKSKELPIEHETYSVKLN